MWGADSDKALELHGHEELDDQYERHFSGIECELQSKMDLNELCYDADHVDDLQNGTPASQLISSVMNVDGICDLSYSNLCKFPKFLLQKKDQVQTLRLDHNLIEIIPFFIDAFQNLVTLDVSNNALMHLSDAICYLPKLKNFSAQNNNLQNNSLPKDFGMLSTLETVNLSGNKFDCFPMQLFEIHNLRILYLGGNGISLIPPDIKNLKKVELLYLGGNGIKLIPEEISQLTTLTSLMLSDNLIQEVPRSLSHLQQLKSLTLHNNQISTLPSEIVSLSLIELSLRNNPLILRFVEDLLYQPPSLLELAARCIKIKHISYESDDLPINLIQYLGEAQRCVNPNCKGVYFSTKVEHVKFVDFCGKYRVPLLQYLCSPNCTINPISGDSDSDEDVVRTKMKRVLLG